MTPLVLLAFIPVSAAVAAVCQDELATGTRIATPVMVFSFLAAWTLALWNMVPLWTAVAVLALLFLLFVLTPAGNHVALLFPIVAFLSFGSPLALPVHAFLALAVLSLGIHAAATSRAKRWPHAIVPGLKTALPGALVTLVLLPLWLL